MNWKRIKFLLRVFTPAYWRREKALRVLQHARFYVGHDYDAVHVIIDCQFKVMG